MLDCFSVTIFVLIFRGLPFKIFSDYMSTQFQTAVPFIEAFSYSSTVELLDTGNSDRVSRMLSLTKYEIGNNHKGQVLGSVWVEGGWGVLTISDSKNSATVQALCPGVFSCRSLRCLSSVFIISKIYKSTLSQLES